MSELRDLDSDEDMDDTMGEVLRTEAARTDGGEFDGIDIDPDSMEMATEKYESDSGAVGVRAMAASCLVVVTTLLMATSWQ